MKRVFYVAVPVAALAVAPLLMVSPELAFSTAATQNCIEATRRVIGSDGGLKITETSTSFSTESAAQDALQGVKAAKAISQGEASPRLMGVFMTVVYGGLNVSADCSYSAAQTGSGFVGAKLQQIAIDHIPTESSAVKAWPGFSTGYLDRFRYFWPAPSADTSHL